MKKKMLKSVCLFCGDEFDYTSDGVWPWEDPPLRKFCGDSSWSTEYHHCHKLKHIGFPETYKSYIWLCKIYKSEIGYKGDTTLQPYINSNWEEHYAILSAQYSKDAAEYYS